MGFMGGLVGTPMGLIMGRFVWDDARDFSVLMAFFRGVGDLGAICFFLDFSC